MFDPSLCALPLGEVLVGTIGCTAVILTVEEHSTACILLFVIDPAWHKRCFNCYLGTGRKNGIDQCWVFCDNSQVINYLPNVRSERDDGGLRVKRVPFKMSGRLPPVLSFPKSAYVSH